MTDRNKEGNEAPRVTPEMLKAGYEAAAEHSFIFADAVRTEWKEEMIIAVYRAMIEASPRNEHVDL